MHSHSTLVPNIVFDRYLPELKLAELKILLVVIRQTIGWKNKLSKSQRKEIDWISVNQLAFKTGCSKRAINEGIQSLIGKRLIDVLSSSGMVLDVPEKRRGQQKLFYRPSSAITALVNKVWKTDKYCRTTDPANADFDNDLRKKIHQLAQNMRITKETLQN